MINQPAIGVPQVLVAFLKEAQVGGRLQTRPGRRSPEVSFISVGDFDSFGRSVQQAFEDHVHFQVIGLVMFHDVS